MPIDKDGIHIVSIIIGMGTAALTSLSAAGALLFKIGADRNKIDARITILEQKQDADMEALQKALNQTLKSVHSFALESKELAKELNNKVNSLEKNTITDKDLAIRQSDCRSKIQLVISDELHSIMEKNAEEISKIQLDQGEIKGEIKSLCQVFLQLQNEVRRK
jgi:hypothetical protein